MGTEKNQANVARIPAPPVTLFRCRAPPVTPATWVRRRLPVRVWLLRRGVRSGEEAAKPIGILVGVWWCW